MQFYNTPEFKPEDMKPVLAVLNDPPPGQRWLAVWVEFTQPKGASPLLLRDVVAIDDAAERYPLTGLDCEVPVREPLTFIFVFPSTIGKPGMMTLDKYKKRGAWYPLLALENGILEPVGAVCVFEANLRKQVLTVLKGKSPDDHALTLERQDGYTVAKSVKKLDPAADLFAGVENRKANAVLLFLVKTAAKSFELQVGTSPKVLIPSAPVAPVAP